MTICRPSCPAKYCDNLSPSASRNEYLGSSRLARNGKGAKECDNLFPFPFGQGM